MEEESWIIHGYQGIPYVSKWHAMQVERISTRPISMIFRCAPQVLAFHLTDYLLFLKLFWKIPGAPREHQGTTKDQFGSSWGLQGPFCVEVTFQEIPKSWNIDSLVFPVTVFDEHRRNRCGIDARSLSNHPWLRKTPDLLPQAYNK